MGSHVAQLAVVSSHHHDFAYQILMMPLGLLAMNSLFMLFGWQLYTKQRKQTLDILPVLPEDLTATEIINFLYYRGEDF